MANLKRTLFDSTGAIKVPVGTTAQRPSNPEQGDLRYNSSLNELESYTGSFWVGLSLRDGTSPSKAIPADQSITSIVERTGQTDGDIWILDNSGNPVRTKLFVNPDNQSAYVLIGGITDNTTHGRRTGGQGTWFNNWSSTNTFGTPETANLSESYKNNLWWNYDYDDVLVMQGLQNQDEVTHDFFANSTEVAYTSNSFLSNAKNLRTYLSGTDGPDLNTNGFSGQTFVPVNFIKGSAQQSYDRYRSDPKGELSPDNFLHFGPNNNENFRYACINALGCRHPSNNENTEHQAWVGDVDTNYSELNYPEPNWSSTWGIDTPNGWLYWLWWAKS